MMCIQYVCLVYVKDSRKFFLIKSQNLYAPNVGDGGFKATNIESWIYENVEGNAHLDDDIPASNHTTYLLFLFLSAEV